MKINMTANAIEKPAEMSLAAQLAWDYFEINKGGWIAVGLGDNTILVTDESGDLENGFVCPDEDAFIAWLEDTAEDHFENGEGAVEFLVAANWIDPRLLTLAPIIAEAVGAIRFDAQQRKEARENGRV